MRLIITSLLLITFIQVEATTLSIMIKYVDQEREEADRRTKALFSKNTKYLCPKRKEKGMSLCVRDYIKKCNIETASTYAALVHFVGEAAHLDKENKIYESEPVQILEIETLLEIQKKVKKENMICAKLKPSGPQSLLDAKKVCWREEKQFRERQQKLKEYVQNKILQLTEIQQAEGPSVAQSEWRTVRMGNIQKELVGSFPQRYYSDEEIQITKQDILDQHKTTFKKGCSNIPQAYKKKIKKGIYCEAQLRALMEICLKDYTAQLPEAMEDKDIVKEVQGPLPCYYQEMKKFFEN